MLCTCRNVECSDSSLEQVPLMRERCIDIGIENEKRGWKGGRQWQLHPSSTFSSFTLLKGRGCSGKFNNLHSTQLIETFHWSLKPLGSLLKGFCGWKPHLALSCQTRLSESEEGFSNNQMCPCIRPLSPLQGTTSPLSFSSQLSLWKPKGSNRDVLYFVIHQFAWLLCVFS
jgi:hypothetical protein